LDARAAADVNQKVGIVFPDVKEAFTIHVRHGVAEIRPRSVQELDGLKLDLKVTADSAAWKEMLAKIRNPVATLAGFEYNPAMPLHLAKFLRLFDPPKMKRPFEPVVLP